MSHAYVLNSKRGPPAVRPKKKPIRYAVVNNVALPSRLTNAIPGSLKHRTSSQTVLLSCFVDMNAGGADLVSKGVDNVPKGPYNIRVSLDDTWGQVTDAVLYCLRGAQRDERQEWLSSEGTLLHDTYQDDRLTAAKRRNAALDAGQSIRDKQNSSLRSRQSIQSDGGLFSVRETNGTKITPSASMYYPGSDTGPIAPPLRNEITSDGALRQSHTGGKRRLGPEDQAAFISDGSLNALSGLLESSPCGTGVQDRSLGPVVPSSGSSGDIPRKGTAAYLCLLLRPADPVGHVMRFKGDVLQQARMEAYLGGDEEGGGSSNAVVDSLPFQNVLSHYLAEAGNDDGTTLRPKDLHWCLSPDPALCSRKVRNERIKEAEREAAAQVAISRRREQALVDIEDRRTQREHTAIQRSYQRDVTLQRELLAVPPKIAGFDLERKDAHAAVERQRASKRISEANKATREHNKTMEAARRWGGLVATSIILPEERARAHLVETMEDELEVALDSFLQRCGLTQRNDRVKAGMYEIRDAIDEYANLESVRPDPLDPIALATADTARALVSGCAIKVAPQQRSNFRPGSTSRSYCTVRPGTFSERGRHPAAVASNGGGEGVKRDAMGSMLQALGMPGVLRSNSSQLE